MVVGLAIEFKSSLRIILSKYPAFFNQPCFLDCDKAQGVFRVDSFEKLLQMNCESRRFCERVENKTLRLQRFLDNTMNNHRIDRFIEVLKKVSDNSLDDEVSLIC